MVAFSSLKPQGLYSQPCIGIEAKEGGEVIPVSLREDTSEPKEILRDLTGPSIRDTLPKRKLPKVISGKGIEFVIRNDGKPMRLGKGGFGEVFLGVDKKSGKLLALKLFRYAKATYDVVLREATFTKVLSEAKCGPKYFGFMPLTPNGVHQPWVLAMEYVGTEEGTPGDLYHLMESELARERRGEAPCLTPGQWIDILLQLAKNVHRAHKEGVVLVDLKAENVLIRTSYNKPPKPLVADFSLAVCHSDSLPGFGRGRLEDPNTFWDYPNYAPELTETNFVGPVNDIYSLGSIFFQVGCIVLGGKVPSLQYLAAECVRYDQDSRPTCHNIIKRLKDIRRSFRRRDGRIW